MLFAFSYILFEYVLLFSSYNSYIYYIVWAVSLYSLCDYLLCDHTSNIIQEVLSACLFLFFFFCIFIANTHDYLVLLICSCSTVMCLFNMLCNVSVELFTLYMLNIYASVQYFFKRISCS